ncbi:C40 family peptidase [Kutzneria buriramensis]|uniref:Cell wall-associated NlpC family hydrolase n=1 Tax=Kutzneria buriramensis TaxID=1045776 RepID=A0A3E0HQP5_9PSEU|nr:NlpC/P60 family protein [Kutzneria buriramensis]REH48711.1 cell wall-associated NlpC family hydrolase [Kutzneria buriramensis]
MASNRIKHVMRGALAFTAMATVVGLNPGPAVADPTPSTPQEAKAQLDAASQAAEQASQAYLAAQDDLKAKQDLVAKSAADIQTFTQQAKDAQAKEDQYRGQVDQLASAAYTGVQFTQLSALLTGKSAQDFLDQSTELQFLAQQNAAVMDGYDNAIKTANDSKTKTAAAQKTQQAAADAEQAIVNDLGNKKAAADAAVAKSQSVFKQLDAAAKGLLNGGDTGVFLGPPGAAGTAMNAAVSQRGVPYVWGGTTPAGFDCSGLTQWAYRQAGIDIPRSAAAQYTVGKAVSLDGLAPGDLIFYGSSASNIHHVSMYVGDGKVVHAPTEGEDVRIVPIQNSGSDIFGAKRIVG